MSLIRKGDQKLRLSPDQLHLDSGRESSLRIRAVELYNLANDAGEATDLAASNGNATARSRRCRLEEIHTSRASGKTQPGLRSETLAKGDTKKR